MLFSTEKYNGKSIFKAYIKYLMAFALFVILGNVFVCLVEEDTLPKLFNTISVHFEIPFYHSVGMLSILREIFKISLLDIVSVVIIFIFSFSFFNSLVTFLVLIYNGFKTGVSFFLCFKCRALLGGIPNMTSVITYFIFSLIINAILIIYSYHSSKYSRGLIECYKNNLSGKIGDRLNRGVFYAVFSLAVISLIIVVNAIYCLSIYLIKKG